MSDSNDTYHAQNLQIVGSVEPGLDIFRWPKFEEDFGNFRVRTIPLTIISYTESLSVAKCIAAAKGQLSVRNPSPELVALGASDLLNVIGTGNLAPGLLQWICAVCELRRCYAAGEDHDAADCAAHALDTDGVVLLHAALVSLVASLV